MADYGYSTPYIGQRQPDLPPGYMEAATAPGRNLAAGIQQFAAGIGQAIQRYQTRKAENESATQTFETLSGLANQALASDPQYQAMQRYYETGQLPAGVTENDLNRFANKVQADRQMISKMVGIGDKFGDMSLAKKKAAIGDMALVLNQYQNRSAADVQRAQAEAELLKLDAMRREAAGAAQFPEAMRAAVGVVPGQAPQIQYRNVEQQVLSQYQNLTPSQMQAVLGTIQARKQAVPPGLVPLEAEIGGVKYGRTAGNVTSIEIPNTGGLRQVMVDNKPVGAPVKGEMAGQAVTDYTRLPENLQKTADALAKDFRNEKTLQNAQIAGGFLNQMETFGKNIGTPEYKASDDIALVFSFMKTLDPGSTVREGEFANAQNAGGVPEKIINIYNKARSGQFLTDEQRKDFINTAKRNLEGLQKEAQKTARSYQKTAKDRGIPEYLVVPENALSPQTPEGQTPQEVQLPRFNSIAEAEANLQPGQKAMVFDPAIRKRREFIKQ